MSLSPQKTAIEQRAVADRQLVEACLARGDGDRGWEALVAQFSGLVAHVVSKTASCRQVPLSAADREDLVADVFLRCFAMRQPCCEDLRAAPAWPPT